MVCSPPHVSEALALREGLELVANLCLKVAIVEIDVEQITNAVNKNAIYDPAGAIIEDIKVLLKLCVGIEVW